MIQNSVEASLNASRFVPCLQQLGEDRHERRRERRLREQVRHQVRDLRGDRERRRRRARAEEVRGDDLPREPDDAGERRRDREDRRVRRDPPPRRIARAVLGAAVGDLLSAHRAAAFRTGRYSTHASRRNVVAVRLSTLNGQHPFTEEADRARAFASATRTVATRRGSRRTSAGSSTPSARATMRPPTPSTRRWCRRSTRPSSAARCTATTAPARSPAPPAFAAAQPSRRGWRHCCARSSADTDPEHRQQRRCVLAEPGRAQPPREASSRSAICSIARAQPVDARRRAPGRSAGRRPAGASAAST